MDAQYAKSANPPEPANPQLVVPTAPAAVVAGKVACRPDPASGRGIGGAVHQDACVSLLADGVPGEALLPQPCEQNVANVPVNNYGFYFLGYFLPPPFL